MDLSITGRPLVAAEAKERGLAYQVVSLAQLEEVTMALASELAVGPTIAYREIKNRLMQRLLMIISNTYKSRSISTSDLLTNGRFC